MDAERLVDDYIEAWNQKDIDRILRLTEKRAAYFDAYWMEYCSGRDLRQYLQDGLTEDRYWYERTDEVLCVDNSVIYRYVAHELIDSGVGPAIFNGAEVLTLRDEKIVAISNFYCDPNPFVLEEVARLAASRHAETRPVHAGLSALKSARFKSLLSDAMIKDQAYLDAGLTQPQLARQIGCSADHLTQIITDQYGKTFRNFLDQFRVKHAEKLLLDESEDPHYVIRVAFQSGFGSFESFENSFRRVIGESPEEFRQHNGNKIDSDNGPSLN